MEPELTLGQLQEEVSAWARRNFGPAFAPYHQPLLGAMEELGELAHAHLKQEQGIRGTKAEHEAKAKDAVGDIIIYLVDYCAQRGWSLQQIVETTWAQVKQRNWKQNPVDGVSG